jgi:hypothetical protein
LRAANVDAVVVQPIERRQLQKVDQHVGHRGFSLAEKPV